MFGFKRKHVVDKNGNLQNRKKGLDDYLKPKKKNKYKPFFIFLGLVILAIAIWFGANAYSAYTKILDKNSTGGSPFLSFLDSITDPDQLDGEGDGRINILLLGNGGSSHPGGTLTDTIQVLSIDPQNKKAAALSLPRDLYVEIDGYGGAKINQVFSIGENNSDIAESGAALMKKTISEILDLPIHYYVKLDFDGFVDLIDEIGGVDVYVENELYDPLYPAEDMVGYEPFYIEAGSHHMNGATALKYARSRETTSDFDRSKRQQQIMIATKERVLDLGFLANPSKIVGVMQVLGNHLRMDFEVDELKRLSEIIMDIDTSEINTEVLDTSSDGPLESYSDNGYYIVTKTGNWLEVQRIAHEIFTDPYLEEENASIEVLNGSSTVGVAKEASDTLTSYGYNIINLDTAENNYDTTTIYDYSDGQYPYTVKFLQERYNAQVVTQPTTTSAQIDITLIIGDDYNS